MVFYNIFITFICLFTYVYCVCCDMAHLWKSKDLHELVLVFHHLGPGD